MDKSPKVHISRTLESKRLTRSRFHLYLYSESNIHKLDKVGFEKESVIKLEKSDEGTQIIIARPEKEKIEMALEKTGMSTQDLHCSICNKPITDVKQIRAIFPYHSALVCCDNIECLIACRNKLLAESNL